MSLLLQWLVPVQLNRAWELSRGQQIGVYSEGHTAMLVTLSGQVTVNGTQQASDAEWVLLDGLGTGATVCADCETAMLVLTGTPLDAPGVGQEPFVMNTRDEIRQAVDNVRTGRFGKMAV